MAVRTVNTNVKSVIKFWLQRLIGEICGGWEYSKDILVVLYIKDGWIPHNALILVVTNEILCGKPLSNAQVGTRVMATCQSYND